MATREESKAERRRAIVRAARSLMQETGQTGFSMRALAERAGVSVATPYNLFGSKQTVMYAVLDADLADYQSRLEQLECDEIDVFFEAVSVAVSLYSAEPGFYRAVLFAVYSDGGTEFRAMFGGPRHAMWRRLVGNARAAGKLDPQVDDNAFAVHLGQILFACILEWVNGLITLEELETKGHYGFAVALRGMAMERTAARLRSKSLQLQKRLRARNRQPRRAASQPATA